MSEDSSETAVVLADGTRPAVGAILWRWCDASFRSAEGLPRPVVCEGVIEPDAMRPRGSVYAGSMYLNPDALYSSRSACVAGIGELMASMRAWHEEEMARLDDAIDHYRRTHGTEGKSDE